MKRALEKLKDACEFYGKTRLGEMIGSSRAGINVWNSRKKISPDKIPHLMLVWPAFEPRDFVSDDEYKDLLKEKKRVRLEMEKELIDEMG